MLSAAALLSVGAGSALAVPGPSGRGSAAVAQYGDEKPAAAAPQTPSATPGDPPASSAPPATQPPTLAPPADAPDGPKSTEVEDRRDTPGASNRTPSAPTTREVVRRVESGAQSGELPVTGMAIVPVLAVGLLLLLAGTVLRRRARAVA